MPQLLAEYSLLILLVAFVITQVIAPLVLQRPLWPMFRSKSPIDRELEAVRAEAADADKHREIDRLRASISRVLEVLEQPVANNQSEQKSTTEPTAEDNPNTILQEQTEE